MTGEVNGGILRSAVPIVSVIVAIISLSISGVMWLAHLEDRISGLEQSQRYQDAKIDGIDRDGTRKLGLVDDRQNNTMRRLEDLERRVNERWGRP